MSPDVVSIEIPGTRDQVLTIMKEKKISGIPVLKGKSLVGLITQKDLLFSPEETQLGLLMRRDPITIGPDAPIDEAAKLLLDHNIRRLPVVEEGVLIGILSVSDLMQAVVQMRITEDIREYTSRSCAVWEETPLPVIKKIIELTNLGEIPVVDSGAKLSGIFTEYDLITNAVIEESQTMSNFSQGGDSDKWSWDGIRSDHTINFSISRINLRDIPVKEVMERRVITVTQNEGISSCALKMKRSRLDQFPVVTEEDNNLVAMIYDRNFLTLFQNEKNKI